MIAKRWRKEDTDTGMVRIAKRGGKRTWTGQNSKDVKIDRSG